MPNDLKERQISPAQSFMGAALVAVFLVIVGDIILFYRPDFTAVCIITALGLVVACFLQIGGLALRNTDRTGDGFALAASVLTRLCIAFVLAGIALEWSRLAAFS